MSRSVCAARETAKPRPVKSGPPKGHRVYQILPFELFLRELWPQDRTKNYMRLTGAPQRTAKRRLAGKHPDYSEVVAILRSEYGFQFLKHLMGDARPHWFSGIERAKHLGDLRRQVAQQQRELAQLEMQIE